MTGLPARFMQKVDKDGDGCWTWTAAKRGNGYGNFWVDGRSQGAHRFAFEQARGPIPAGMEIDHLCRNRICVNPAHLEAVQKGENIRRGLRGYGARRLCRNGLHDIRDESNVIARADGHRQCRPCAQESWKRSWGRKKKSNRSESTP